MMARAHCMRICSQPCLLVATNIDMTFWSHRAFMLDYVCLPYSIAIVTIHGPHVCTSVCLCLKILTLLTVNCYTLAFFRDLMSAYKTDTWASC